MKLRLSNSNGTIEVEDDSRDDARHAFDVLSEHFLRSSYGAKRPFDADRKKPVVDLAALQRLRGLAEALGEANGRVQAGLEAAKPDLKLLKVLKDRSTVALRDVEAEIRNLTDGAAYS